MKAFFIFKDGEVVGSPIGYTTELGAKKALVGTKEWYTELWKYDKGNGKKTVPQESIDLGLYKWSESVQCYLFDRTVWSRKIWNKYVEEHYKIVEKEFDVVFKD